MINRNGGVFHCEALNLSLKVPANSVDQEIQLVISTIDESNAPPIQCDFGEMILYDVIQIKPTGIKFNTPAILTINHSIIQLPELSSIVIKCYDYGNKEWVRLPFDTGWFSFHILLIP